MADTSQWFMVAVLGVFRVTHLLSAEDGPFDAFARLRAFAGNSVAGKLLDCFYCASLWVAAPFAFAIADSTLEALLFWVGLSGGAIVVQRITTRAEPSPTAPYFEAPALDPAPPIDQLAPPRESENEHGLLWKQTRDAP